VEEKEEENILKKDGNNEIEIFGNNLVIFVFLKLKNSSAQLIFNSLKCKRAPVYLAHN